jgi:thiosulfate reductase cytochrome b subunit
MKTLNKKHPLAIRWFHWINFPVLLLMIWSGLLIYWSNAVYRIGLGNYTLLTFFPERFFQALGIPYQLAKGMSLHFFFMWFFVINGCFMLPTRSFPESGVISCRTAIHSGTRFGSRFTICI